ncbi:neural cell adhesion molecule 2-like isoform X2 [Macrobrachium rosenbergii]|uniref:neural cell adhesion molecule 2-like isoform X2 n=1 Tax=Macrobrachium rosenbergii TaxID=79674 RepID=UPI0034D3AC40
MQSNPEGFIKGKQILERDTPKPPTMMMKLIVLNLLFLLNLGLCEVPGAPGECVLRESRCFVIPSNQTEEMSPQTDVVVLEGKRAVLPCDITPPELGDTPILVLFYIGAMGTSIYTIDARTAPLSRSVHWSLLGNRAHFDVTSTRQGLVIDDVSYEDEAEYRCRVDFRSSPTRNLRVKLTVVVPPRRVSITNQSGTELSGVIGPYPMGGSLNLTCKAYGGKPPPRVSWWHEGSLLDDVVETHNGDVAMNTLFLPNLSRQHLYRVLTCQAENSNMSLPRAATVTLDMSFPPMEVKILGSNVALSEGERYSLVCEASGSRPPATLTWWMDGVLMTDTKDQVLYDGNVSRSTVHVAPTRRNNGAIVSCRAQNSLLEATALEDSRKLNVHFPPKLQLHVGRNLNITNIKEGDDVYFECDIKANPPAFRKQWFLNGEELHHNSTAGVIQSNQSLVLQKVTRVSSGMYSCRATNSNGAANSNALHLNVKFAPICAPEQKWVYGGGRHQPINVTCKVEAHPEASTFQWAFNTSSEFVEIAQNRIQSSRSRSMASYTPQTHHDFGSLLCWGVNEVAVQRNPCVFHIVPAAVPEPAHNCSVWHNASATGEVVVMCQPGWSGGLAQKFTLEVREGIPKRDHTGKSKVLAILRDQTEPHFTVTGLAPGKEYRLTVVASNAQGTAPPTHLVHLTPIDVAEKRTSPTAAESPLADQLMTITPILAILVGVVASLVVCTIIIVFVIRARNANNRNHPQTRIVYDKAIASTNSSKGCDEGGFVQQQEKRPDIVLIKDGSGAPDEGQQLVREYNKPPEGSFFINPGTLLNNGMVVTRETDSLLHNRITTSIHPPISTSCSTFLLAQPSTDSLNRSSYSGGCSTASISTGASSPQGSTSTVALHPDYYVPEGAAIAVAADPQRAPLVSPPHVPGTRESCV